MGNDQTKKQMNKKLKSPLKLKDGRTFPIGTDCVLSFEREKISCVIGTEKFRLGVKNSHKYFGAPFTKEPTEQTLERWGRADYARTVTGEKVELDGIGSDGAPSWFLALGMI